MAGRGYIDGPGLGWCDPPDPERVPCAFCGEFRDQEDADAGRCWCRECPSCLELWPAASLREKTDGRPAVEMCRFCTRSERKTMEVPVHTVKCPECGVLLVTLALIEDGHTCPKAMPR